MNIFEKFLSKKSVFKNKYALSSSFLPSQILHREKEIEELAKVLAPLLRNQAVSNVFIYGKTGTGKSLVTKHVTNQLLEASKKLNLKITLLYVNCNLQGVSDTEYRLLAYLSNLLGEKLPVTGLPTSQVYQKFFNKIEELGGHFLIVLDEIDILVKKSGDRVLYNLVRINDNLNNARINIIGISNDVTFLKKIDARIKSSLSEEEIVFSPYNALQLKDILLSRAKIAFNEGAISEDVIAKIAAIAAKEHGDARKAIDLLRIAGEIADREFSDKVLEKHVDEAIEKLEKDTIIELAKNLPRQSQAVLYSIIKSCSSSPVTTSTDIYQVYREVSKFLGINQLTQRRVNDLINEMVNYGLINSKVISKGRYGKRKEIVLGINDSLRKKIENILATEFEMN